jgi:isochorismate synthase
MSLGEQVAQFISETIQSTQEHLVCFRLPLSTQIEVKAGTLVEADFSPSVSGFYIHSFATKEKGSRLSPQKQISIPVADWPKISFTWPNWSDEPIVQDTPHSQFEQTVKAAVQEIKAGHLKKVVVSRIKTGDRPDAANPFDSFAQICAAYPLAYVCLLWSPSKGIWLGASPEYLMRLEEGKRFHTLALAGTQEWRPSLNLSEVVWRQKEIQEQALVSRYIINCLKTLRVRDFEEVGPKTVQSGHLLHLATQFSIDLNLVQDDFTSKMVHLLHPTSAVGGMPKAAAMDWLSKQEHHNRSLFCGFWGNVALNGEAHLFVNIRVSQWTKNQIIFFAGAGITEDSDAEQEWKETGMKISVLERYLLPENNV